MVSFIYRLVSKHDYIPYIHEYRTLNSELVIRKLIQYPMVLQHHGSTIIYCVNRRLNPIDFLKRCSKLKREKLLKKIKGAIFVLNEAEKRYLEEVLGVKALVKVRTMGTSFDKLKPISEEEKRRLRKELGIGEENTVLCSYVGVYREKLGTVKGAHLVAKIWEKVIKKNTKAYFNDNNRARQFLD